ncbi:MAG TPA: alanine--tRNA ligase-related protein, partial [Pyrinomonadaceae bacterium]|nr:alanine--tRNA ligase-related protein [Pyrinomonadaceae bacterium]
MSIYETFDEQKQFACRVIADHARSTAFAIADGILPGNEGRNYVLRKIMRRAIYHGREHLGFEGLFFNKVCDFVIDLMKDAFPELETQRDFIGKMVRLEEERFGNTLTVGLKELKQVINKLKEKESEELDNFAKALSGEITVEEFKRSLEEVKEKYGDKHKLEEFAQKVHKNKIPLDIALNELKEKVNFFHYDNDYPIVKYEFLNVWLDKVIRNEGTVYENDLIYSQPFEERWEKVNKYYNEYQDALSLVRVYDTHGVPKDLISVIIEEHNFEPQFLKFFNENFEQFLADLQKQSDVGKTKQAEKINPIYADLQNVGIKSNFHGYDKTEVEGAKILALVKNDERVDELNEGDEGLIVLDETPFYAEAGGQVGDVGAIQNAGFRIQDSKNPKSEILNPTIVKVLDTFAPIAGIVLHKSKIEKGVIRVGDEVTATVDVAKRDATRRNHTATHLVHAALKEVLGTHVKQAGSVVAPT